jgi:molybdopterin-binding protein
METLDAQQAADLLHLNVKRVQSLARAGKLPAFRIGRKWLFHRDRIEELLGAPASQPTLTLSARNRLHATIANLRMDGLMAEVQLKVGDQDLVAMITRSSAERLGLAKGDTVYAVIKATEVMIGTEGGRE